MIQQFAILILGLNHLRVTWHHQKTKERICWLTSQYLVKVGTVQHGAQLIFEYDLVSFSVCSKRGVEPYQD